MTPKYDQCPPCSPSNPIVPLPTTSNEITFNEQERLCIGEFCAFLNLANGWWHVGIYTGELYNKTVSLKRAVELMIQLDKLRKSGTELRALPLGRARSGDGVLDLFRGRRNVGPFDAGEVQRRGVRYIGLPPRVRPEI